MNSLLRRKASRKSSSTGVRADIAANRALWSSMFVWGRLSGGLGLVIRWLSIVMSTSSHPVSAVERRCTTMRPPLSIPRLRSSHKRFLFLNWTLLPLGPASREENHKPHAASFDDLVGATVPVNQEAALALPLAIDHRHRICE